MCPDDKKEILKKLRISRRRRLYGDLIYRCEVPSCYKRFASMKELTAHQKTHIADKPFTCDWPNCNFATTLNTEMLEHIRKHIIGKPFKCCSISCSIFKKEHLRFLFIERQLFHA